MCILDINRSHSAWTTILLCNINANCAPRRPNGIWAGVEIMMWSLLASIPFWTFPRSHQKRTRLYIHIFNGRLRRDLIYVHPPPHRPHHLSPSSGRCVGTLAEKV